MEDQQKITIRNRGIYILPNLFTLSALFGGFYAIVASLKGNYDNAAAAIFISMILDALDGRVARLTHTVTNFGAELDSLSDMICFGLAPALVMYSWSLYSLGKLGWLAAFVYVAAVALRLARFNTQIGKADKRYFQGLACTPAAGVMAGLIWVGNEFAVTMPFFRIITVAVTVAVAVLMVSNIRYRSFKEFDLRNHVSFLVILALALIIVFISLDPPQVLFIIFALYACYGPVETIWGLRQKRRQRHHVKNKQN